MKKLLIFLVLIVPFSCRKENSEKVNQDEIWTDYTLIYSGDLNSTYARVSFKHNDANGEGLVLSNKSEIKINNESPSFESTYRWYEKVYTGVQSSANFSYTNTDDKSFQNTVDLAPSIQLPEIDSIFKDSTVALNWVGDAITANELIAFVLIDEALDAKLVLGSDTIGRDGVYLDKSKLALIASDSVTIHFERWLNQEVSGTSAGGQCVGHYISSKKKVKVVTVN